MSFFKILLLGFIGLLIGQKSFSQDTIHWKPDYKLKWEDFQGNPDANSKYGAVGSPGISYTLFFSEDSFNVKVLCYFLKSKSWSKFKKSDTLLMHEQVHFDIAELFARKLRKAFGEYKFNHQTVSLDLKKIFLHIKQEKDSMNILYDKETDLSRNRKQQLLWNKKIKSELDKLKKYGST